MLIGCSVRLSEFLKSALAIFSIICEYQTNTVYGKVLRTKVYRRKYQNDSILDHVPRKIFTDIKHCFTKINFYL